MAVGCDEVQDLIRRAALDQLQADVLRHEDQFVVGGPNIWSELNQYAIAEWAWNLLERQRAAMLEAVERALSDGAPG